MIKIFDNKNNSLFFEKFDISYEYIFVCLTEETQKTILSSKLTLYLFKELV